MTKNDKKRKNALKEDNRHEAARYQVPDAEKDTQLEKKEREGTRRKARQPGGGGEFRFPLSTFRQKRIWWVLVLEYGMFRGRTYVI